MTEDIARALLAFTAGYCYTMWLGYAVRAYQARKTLTAAEAVGIQTFTYRVGLVGTIAAAALYLGA